MDASDRAKLGAAIGAHCKWLEEQGVALPADATQLETVHVLGLMPQHQVPSFPPGGARRLFLACYRLRRRRERRRVVPWTRLRMARARRKRRAVSGALVDVVIASLHRLCALRTRDLARTTRQQRLRAANELAANAQDEQERLRAKLVEAAHDDSHLEAVDPCLEQLQQRLRTACRQLSAFMEKLDERHEVFTQAGLARMSAAPVEIGGARAIVLRCEILDGNLTAFRRYIQGPSAEPLSGHVGPADGKAWHRVRSDSKLWLKNAGAKSSLAVRLFPSGARVVGLDEKKRQHDRERKEVNRAKKRATSKR
jgi:hypothetical protein